MAANQIGLYTRVAGVWERVNAGTPEGFSGPQVKNAGVWKNSVVVHAQASAVWRICWVNIDGEINVGAYTASDFDISPYNVDAYIDINSDGSVDRKNFGTVANNYSNWRQYDCGRDYQYYVERSSPFGDAGYLFAEPALTTWTDLTGTITFGGSRSGSGNLFLRYNWNVKIREKVSAPSSGNDIGTVFLFLEAEV